MCFQHKFIHHPRNNTTDGKCLTQVALFKKELFLDSIFADTALVAKGMICTGFGSKLHFCVMEQHVASLCCLITGSENMGLARTVVFVD